MPKKEKSSKKKEGKLRLSYGGESDELITEKVNKMEISMDFDELDKSLAGPFIELAEKVNEMEARILTLELKNEHLQQNLLFRVKGFQ